ncbi:Hpt domain-containing protein, partial [Mesorhizobium sp. M1A.F.Ca.IN.022.07.1.1]
MQAAREALPGSDLTKLAHSLAGAAGTFGFAEIVLAATILSWFIIAAGLAQTTIYLLQLVLAGYALSKRPPVA